MNQKKTKLLKIFCIFQFFIAGTSFSQQLQIVEQNATTIRLHLATDFSPILEGGGTFNDLVSLTDLALFKKSNGQEIPYYPVLLNISSDRAQVNLLSAKDKAFVLDHVVNFIDTPLSGTDSLTTDNRSGNITTQNNNMIPPVTIEKKGVLQGNNIWKVNIYPYDFNSNTNEIIYRSDILFEIIVPSTPSKNNSQPYKFEIVNDIKTLSNTSTLASSLSAQSLKKTMQTEEAWKIIVDTDGIYKITGEDLRDAGLTLLNIDIETLKLTCNNKNIAVFVHGWEDGEFDVDDYIEFWGETNKQTFQNLAPDMYVDPYTASNIYWLSWGTEKGTWMLEEQGQVIESQSSQYIRPYSFRQKVHVEKDVYYDRLSEIPVNTLRDLWFYDTGISASKKRDYTFELWHPDDQASFGVEARCIVGGRTSIDSIQHNISAFINDSYLFSGQWKNQDYIDLQLLEPSPVTGADIENGENVFSIYNNIDYKLYDYVMLNWFEISYPRLYRAHEDYLEFTIPPGYTSGHFLFKIDGFESEIIDIYKIGYSKIVGGKVIEYTDYKDFTSMQISFQDNVTSQETHYVAVTQDKKLLPLAIIKDEPSQLKTSNIASDYMIIAHKRFINDESIEKLLQLRQSQGLQTSKINVQDIYDEFNYGRPSPYAIKSFLKWAYDNWNQPRLKYVLLVGDGCYQRYSAVGDTLDLIPVFMRKTLNFGSAASDHWYALLDGNDELPEIHIGRLPVKETQELENVIAKIISYETEPPSGDWSNRLLFIGGNDQVFRTQGNSLVRTTPARFESKKLFTFKDTNLDFDPYHGSTTDFLDYYDKGCALISFHGHGGGAIWADNGLLRLDDVDRMYSQGKLPFILSMTCFTGSFESPSTGSLADALLFTENDGVVGFLGASGVGWTWNDYYLQSEILKYLYTHPTETMGDIVDAGKINYYLSYQTDQNFSQVNQYHLLGDPATRLYLPSQIINVQLDKQLTTQNDSLTVSVKFPYQNGTGKIVMTDSVKDDVLSKDISFYDGQYSTIFRVPKYYPFQTGYFRIFSQDGSANARVHGSANFVLKSFLFDSALVETEKEKLYFSCKLQTTDEIKEMYCRVGGDTLLLQKQNNSWYKTQEGYDFEYQGYNLSYIFYAIKNDNSIIYSPTYVYNVSNVYNLSIDTNSIQLGGQNQVEIQFEINNLSENSTNVPVSVSGKIPGNTTYSIIGTDTLFVMPYSPCRGSVPFSATTDMIDIQVTIDPDSLLNEQNRSDNIAFKSIEINKFNFKQNSGLFVNNTQTDSLKKDEFKAIISKNCFSQTGTISLEKLSKITILEQPDFSSFSGLSAFTLTHSFVNESATPIIVQFSIDDLTLAKIDSQNLETYIYQYVANTNKWLKIPTTRAGRLFSAQTINTGTFALLHSADTQGPNIEISINGQPYVPNSYSSQEPQISIYIQDLNGIDISTDKLQVYLNGEKLDNHDELALPDTVKNGNQIMLALNPKLSSGNHFLNIVTLDCNGNMTELNDLTIKVANSFEIKMLGNYPNPFSEETNFAYILTLPCENLSLKIYSASGRLIRDINPREMSEDPNPYSSDYHEILWDGTDKEGYPVANGLYFYKLSAIADGKTHEITGKIARIQ